MRIRMLRAAMLVAVIASAASAQQPVAAAPAAGALRVFLDCDECDNDYIRTEIPWVAYVRDRADADIHLLVTQIGTGAGGTQYTLNFVGVNAYAGRSDTLQYVTQPTDVQDAVRSGLTRMIQLGLAPYAARTPQGRRLRVESASRDEDEDDRARPPGERDPWNAWIIEVGADGSVEREESVNDRQLDASLEASRITDAWKVGFRADAEFLRTLFEVDVVVGDDTVERTVTRLLENYSAGGVIVKSLGPHWGVGAEAAVSSSTFENTELAIRAAPAVEYSVWPYAEATRRQLTIQYSLGVSAFDYREETIYGKFRETRPTQSLIVGYDVVQPWGSGEATLESSGFLDDFKQYRLEFDGEIDIRLFRGFSLEVGGSAALIRDQLALIKREISEDEILLRLRELRTDYRYNIFIGFSYTFGSIFNSVVNPRFGGGPGEILR
jgi:hypothetical protein